MRYILTALLMLTLFVSAFAQSDTPAATVEPQVVTVIAPTEAPAEATLEATPVAGPVCEEGATCTFNEETPPTTDVDPLTGILFMASGAFLTLLVGILGLYVAGGRILRGVMASAYAMTFFEMLYNQSKARTPAALQKEAAEATRTYEEFRNEVTDGVPVLTKIVLPTPLAQVPTIPRTPPAES